MQVIDFLARIETTAMFVTVVASAFVGALLVERLYQNSQDPDRDIAD